MPASARNQTKYKDRGWCIFEFLLSSLVKISRCYLELSKMSGTATHWYDLREECAANRVPPMAPDEFEAMMNAGVDSGRVKFTSGKDLFDVVIPQYKEGFLRLGRPR